MIVCKKCGYEGTYTGDPCPECGEVFSLNKNDIAEQLSALSIAEDERDYESMLESLHILADVGHTASEREYARILERGELLPRDLNRAMLYFKRAAEKNDAYAAYRYSRLASRESNEASWFWLMFSAILGCKESYPEVAEGFSARGYEEDALYFYALAAACDDVSSIAQVAKRYYNGIGTEPSPAYAKWYMDKLTIPPIYAIKLAYNLRRERAEEPPMLTLKNYNGLLRRLVKAADANGFTTARMRLSEILSERGDTDAMVYVAESNIKNGSFAEGMRLLAVAADAGNIDAHLKLADVYIDGKLAERDLSLAVRHLISAGELGSYLGYERAGDVYCSGEREIRNVNRGLELYDLASVLGSASARETSEMIKSEREHLYNSAPALAPRDAFSAFMRSADMGYYPSMMKLAECFEQGLGTKINRYGAYYWYKKASEFDEAEAFFALGRCYADGIGVDRDFKAARAAFIRAERLGCKSAHGEVIALLDRKLKKSARALYSKAMRLIHLSKYEPAYELLEISSELKYPKAIYTLGCLYEFGKGVPCDRERAYAMYEEAYALRFRDPRARYKLVILKMVKR